MTMPQTNYEEKRPINPFENHDILPHAKHERCEITQHSHYLLASVTIRNLSEVHLVGSMGYLATFNSDFYGVQGPAKAINPKTPAGPLDFTKLQFEAPWI